MKNQKCKKLPGSPALCEFSLVGDSRPRRFDLGVRPALTVQLKRRPSMVTYWFFHGIVIGVMIGAAVAVVLFIIFLDKEQ